MIDLLIYQNDNGTTVTDVTGNEIDYEEWLVQRVEELDDPPLQVICFHVWSCLRSMGGRFGVHWAAENIWHPKHYEGGQQEK